MYNRLKGETKMPEIKSEPVIPVQSKFASYPISLLNLFEIYSVGTYKLKFGVDPPAFSISTRPKLWFDTSTLDLDPEDFIPYQVFRKDKDGIWSIKKIYMQVKEASTPNIPTEGIKGLMPFWEVPVRELLPNERIVSTPFGVSILRTDIIEETKATPFTERDHQLLEAIAKKLEV